MKGNSELMHIDWSRNQFLRRFFRIYIAMGHGRIRVVERDVSFRRSFHIVGLVPAQSGHVHSMAGPGGSEIKFGILD